MQLFEAKDNEKTKLVNINKASQEELETRICQFLKDFGV